MGWTLAGVTFRRMGKQVRVHADGNNAAWMCDRAGCHHPVLFTYLEGRIGSGPNRPTKCPGCGNAYSLSPPFGARAQPSAGMSEQPAPIMDIV